MVVEDKPEGIESSTENKEIVLETNDEITKTETSSPSKNEQHTSNTDCENNPDTTSQLTLDLNVELLSENEEGEVINVKSQNEQQKSECLISETSQTSNSNTTSSVKECSPSRDSLDKSSHRSSSREISKKSHRHSSSSSRKSEKSDKHRSSSREKSRKSRRSENDKDVISRHGSSSRDEYRSHRHSSPSHDKTERSLRYTRSQKDLRDELREMYARSNSQKSGFKQNGTGEEESFGIKLKQPELGEEETKKEDRGTIKDS